MKYVAQRLDSEAILLLSQMAASRHYYLVLLARERAAMRC